VKLFPSPLEFPKKDADETQRANAKLKEIEEWTREELAPEAGFPETASHPSSHSPAFVPASPPLAVPARPRGFGQQDGKWLEAFLEHRKVRAAEESERIAQFAEVRSSDRSVSSTTVTRPSSHSRLRSALLSPILKPKVP